MFDNNNEKKKLTFTIKFGISTAFIFIVVSTALLLLLFVNYTVKSIIFKDIQTQLHDLVAVSSLIVDGDLSSTLHEPSQETSDAYQTIKSQLLSIRTYGTGVRFVYTMRRNEAGEIIFIVDAEENKDLISHIGDLYKGQSPELEQAFLSQKGIFTEKSFTTDAWGTWVSGFAPIYTSDGKFDSILGIDISAKHVIEYQRRVVMVISLFSLFIIFLIVLMSYRLSKKITEPLSELEADVSKIQRLDLSGTTEIKTTFKEIISMSETIDNLKKALRSFRKYVPADLVTQLINTQEEAVLNGERKNLTVMFSDIENFTTLSEHISPDALVDILAGYFGGVTQIIIKHHGVVDKYIGDSVMAFWGAPVDLDYHERNACLATLEIKEYLEAFNQKLEIKGYPQISTRIGIHSGDMIVGNIGYEMRLNYTIIGDNVNLASRIEGLNKFYGTTIIISDAIKEIVGDQVIFRLLDTVVVKGKTKGIKIYELMSMAAVENKVLMKISLLHNKGMMAYYERKFKSAILLFEEVKKLKPQDKAATVMIKRCLALASIELDEEWDGKQKFTEK